jgi:RimJ/RimL family protein N-acetyltransferase
MLKLKKIILINKHYKLILINNKSKNLILKDFHFYSSNKTIFKYMCELKPHKTLNDSKVYLEKLIDRSKNYKAYYWSLCSQKSLCVGTIGVNNIDYFRKTGTIGYAFNKEVVDFSIIFKVIATVLQIFFKNYFYRIEAITQSNNLAAISLLKFFGFVLEGEKKNFYKNIKNKKRVDAKIFCLFKNNFNIKLMSKVIK